MPRYKFEAFGISFMVIALFITIFDIVIFIGDAPNVEDKTVQRLMFALPFVGLFSSSIIGIFTYKRIVEINGERKSFK